MNASVQHFFLSSGFFLLILSGCNSSSIEKIDYSKYLHERINIDMFSEVIHRDTIFSWEHFRRLYPNISIVYLEDGCAPCYPKFLEWHKYMEKIRTVDDYSILFILNARRYEDFLRNVLPYGEIDNRYFYVMDPGKMFLLANGHIPLWLIAEQSFLLDKGNQIRMLGAPYTNTEMIKKFHIVTGVETQNPRESK